MTKQYRAYSLRCSGLANKIKTDVFISDSVDILDEPGESNRYIGLWDTGATITAISSRIVDNLKLPIMTELQSSGANGIFKTTVHVIDIWLPNYLVFRKVPVARTDLMSDIDVLIGMDIIRRGDFSISNFNGKTVFSYRSPSVSTTDYVEQGELLKQVKSTKIERNAPCTCGSGRKYKNCCGRGK